MESGLSTADIMALTDNNNNGMNGLWNNPFIYLVWLAVLGGNGGGLFGNNNNAANLQGMVTRAELYDGFNSNQVNNDLNSIEHSLTNGFNSLGNQVSESRFAAQHCCCETNRNIDAVRFENAKNTCDITTAIHAEGEATRALITANTMQNLRDKVEERDRKLLAAEFQITQQQQTSNIIGELRPCAKPAYITCSPYAAADPAALR